MIYNAPFSDYSQQAKFATINPPYELKAKKRLVESIKELFFDLLAFSTQKVSPQRSRKYKHRAHHANANRYSKEREELYGCKVVGKARNVAQLHLIKKGKDLKAAKALKKEIETSLPDSFIYRKGKFKNQQFTGICMGISIDIGERLLIKGENIESIISSNEKGASKEAAAYQANYRMLLDKHYLLNVLFPQWFKQDIFKGEYADHPLNLSSDEMENELFQGYFLLLSLFFPAEGAEIDYSHPFDETFKKIMIEAKNDLNLKGNHPWLSKIGENAWVINDYVKFKASVMNSSDNPNERLLDAILALTGKMHESDAPKQVIDNKNNFNYLCEILMQGSVSRVNIVANSRKLNYLPVGDSSAHFINDEDCLKQIDTFEDGLYGVYINTDKNGHILSILKNEDGSFYIMDPNKPQVLAKDFQEAQIFLNRLLKCYSYPTLKRPWQEEHRYHEIKFYKIEAHSEV